MLHWTDDMSLRKQYIANLSMKFILNFIVSDRVLVGKMVHLVSEVGSEVPAKMKKSPRPGETGGGCSETAHGRDEGDESTN